MAAVRFLTAVARSVHHGLFGSADVLKQICENIIVPNLQLREEDEELFESNYVDYIRCGPLFFFFCLSTCVKCRELIKTHASTICAAMC